MKQVSLGAIFFLLFPVTVVARPISNDEKLAKAFKAAGLL